MGGEPNDNPRDEAGGHEGITNDDRTRQVGGASGGGNKAERDAGQKKES